MSSCSLLLLFSFLPVLAFADVPSWPQFRGANGQGIAAASEKPPVEFGPDQRLLWKTAVPEGVSSPSIWGDRIFLTAASGAQQWLLGLNRQDGKILWRHEVPAPGPASLHRTNRSAAATPATDGKRVYAYHAGFGLLACDFDGKEVWRFPMAAPFVVNGSGTSPIVADGKVILVCDQQGGNSFVLALDAETGHQAWLTPRPQAVSAYTTPVIWRREGGAEVVVGGSLRVTSYGLTDGKERWTAGGLEGVSVCPTPVLGEGRLYLMSRSFGGSAPGPSAVAGMFLADGDKDGRLSRKEAPFLEKDGVFDFMDQDRDGLVSGDEANRAMEWTRLGDYGLFALKDPGAASGLLSADFTVWKHRSGIAKVASPVLSDGRLFVVQDGGMVTCTDAATGTLIFERERLGGEAGGDYFASPVVADGRIYVCSTRGVVTVLEAGPSLKILARNAVGEPVLASPALAGNRIYIRGASHLLAFGNP
jgi:outer membrane protein assembly factor BamB